MLRSLSEDSEPPPSARKKINEAPTKKIRKVIYSFSEDSEPPPPAKKRKKNGENIEEGGVEDKRKGD